MTYAPIVTEVWEAFVAERKCWQIAESGSAFIITDRARYLSGEEFFDPMTVTFTQEVCPSREIAAYEIGMRSMSVALTKTSIIIEGEMK